MTWCSAAETQGHGEAGENQFRVCLDKGAGVDLDGGEKQVFFCLDPCFWLETKSANQRPSQLPPSSSSPHSSINTTDFSNVISSRTSISLRLLAALCCEESIRDD